jgi:hypothetical protein
MQRLTQSNARKNGYCFAEWAAQEVDRLLQTRSSARTPADRAQVELQIAIVCDAAQRFGRSLTETAEH